MENIRLSPDEMRSRAGQYNEQAEAVGDVIKNMDSLLSALQDEWEGAASKAFNERYQELKPGFVKAQELIGAIASALTATADRFESTDSDTASEWLG